MGKDKLTLDTGSETGSNAKSPILLDCNLDFCKLMERFRNSSCASSGISSLGSRPGRVPVGCDWNNCSGEISCLTELKRTVLSSGSVELMVTVKWGLWPIERLAWVS
jgi:hypothetical protein